MYNITEVVLKILGLSLPVESYSYGSEQEQNSDTGLTAGNPVIKTLQVTFKNQALKGGEELAKILNLARDKSKLEKLELEQFNGLKSLSTVKLEGALLDYDETYKKGDGLTVELTFSVRVLEAYDVKFTKERERA